ncbi:MAG: hypothetical protein N2663_07750 [Chlorobi bacterium]|nr:hypothetical protein [Chlorobiota bacterium]
MVVVVILVAVSIVWSQRFTDRTIVINPLLDTTAACPSGQWNWMASSIGWGEFGSYLEGDAEHAWIQRLGAAIELVRIGSHTSVAFTSDIEFIANPDNNIRFNPRAVFWQEGFLVTFRNSNGYWQIGYYHRCKHDVDNLTIGRERALIYGSVLAKYLWPLTLERWEGVGVLRADVFTIRQDDRTPPTDDGNFPHHKRMTATVGASFHARRALTDLLGIYLASWLQATAYGTTMSTYPTFDGIRTATLNGGITAGIAITGQSHFRIGLTWEYLADTGVNPQPEHSHLVSLTVSIVNPRAIW